MSVSSTQDVGHRDCAPVTPRAEACPLPGSADNRALDFLARLNHELRTPLNAVLGFTQLLQSDPRECLSARQAVQVESIRRASAYLLQLANDLLDLSIVQSGRIRIHHCDIALADLIDEVLQAMWPQAGASGITVEPLYRNAPDVHVLGDPLRLRQVMFNLLTNAIKYNSAGGNVTIAVRCCAAHVRVQVTDTGLGMTPQQLSHLFEPFNRLGREKGRVEGSGLGMVLVRQLVEAMQGHVEVDSQIDRGTTVCVCLRSAADREA